MASRRKVNRRAARRRRNNRKHSLYMRNRFMQEWLSGDWTSAYWIAACAVEQSGRETLYAKIKKTCRLQDGAAAYTLLKMVQPSFLRQLLPVPRQSLEQEEMVLLREYRDLFGRRRKGTLEQLGRKYWRYVLNPKMQLTWKEDGTPIKLPETTVITAPRQVGKSAAYGEISKVILAMAKEFGGADGREACGSV